MKKQIGFRKIKHYPGNDILPLGTFEPLTTGLYNQFPEFWAPVYDEDATDGVEQDNLSNKNLYDHINPNHYKNFSKEVWEMMVDIWGKEAYIKHCEMTAFKYRMRAGLKPEQPVQRDLEKAKWYEDKAKELKTLNPFLNK